MITNIRVQVAGPTGKTHSFNDFDKAKKFAQNRLVATLYFDKDGLNYMEYYSEGEMKMGMYYPVNRLTQ